MTPRRAGVSIANRFAREFRRLAPVWDVTREPEPIAAGGTLIFPDFALRHRSDLAREWLLEIVGFWTPDDVARKLALYRSAGLPNLIPSASTKAGTARNSDVHEVSASGVFLALTRDRQVSEAKAMALENDDRATSEGRVDRRQGPEDQRHLVIGAPE